MQDFKKKKNLMVRINTKWSKNPILVEICQFAVDIVPIFWWSK